MNENESVNIDVKTEPKKGKTSHAILRWALVGLLSLIVGALLITFLLYIPTKQNLVKANTTIDDITTQLNTTEAENETLNNNLDSATLHKNVLKALSEVRGASLAVAADDYAGTRLSLIQVSEALDVLSNLLGTDQKDVITAMQQSATKALSNLQNDLKSAQPDLDLLTSNLVQLEDNLFPNP